MPWPASGRSRSSACRSSCPGTTWRQITVAVIDSGLDYRHPAFKPENLWTNPEPGFDPIYPDDVMGWNYILGHNNPWDDIGHGTFVAGLILAVNPAGAHHADQGHGRLRRRAQLRHRRGGDLRGGPRGAGDQSLGRHQGAVPPPPGRGGLRALARRRAGGRRRQRGRERGRLYAGRREGRAQRGRPRSERQEARRSGTGARTCPSPRPGWTSSPGAPGTATSSSW